MSNFQCKIILYLHQLTTDVKPRNETIFLIIVPINKNENCLFVLLIKNPNIELYLDSGIRNVVKCHRGLGSVGFTLKFRFKLVMTHKLGISK